MLNINFDTSEIFNIYKNIKLDYVYHLGEYSIEQSFDDIEYVYRLIQSIFEVIKLTKHHDAKLIYCGSLTDLLNMTLYLFIVLMHGRGAGF